jgi:hypothetical protein
VLYLECGSMNIGKCHPDVDILTYRTKALYSNLNAQLEFKGKLYCVTHIYRVLESNFSGTQFACPRFDFVFGF